MTTDPKNYSEFWDFYVSEHSLPATRLLHFIGTSLGIALLSPSGNRVNFDDIRPERPETITVFSRLIPSSGMKPWKAASTA